jgi:hypothetical protein
MKLKDFDFELARDSLFDLYTLLELLRVATPNSFPSLDQDLRFVGKMGYGYAIEVEE